MAAPLNTVLPTLDMGVTSWTGTVGSWDENGGGTVSYAWELRLVEDDSVVESGGGSLPQGTGTYSNVNGYYLKVDATNIDGTTEARSKVGTLGIGLKGWWSASLADSPEDLSGGGNDGTYNGGMVTVADVDPVHGGTRAFSFDGIDDYISTTFVAGTEVPTGSLSVAMWALSDTTGQRSLMGDTTQSMLFRWGGSADYILLSAGVSPDRVTGLTTGMSAGEWYLVVGVYDEDAGEYRLEAYGDGYTYTTTQATTGTRSETSTNGWAIGSRDASSPNNEWDGLIDDVRVYGKALSPAEINELYTQGRGYDHRPKGLGDENLWYCPSILDSTTDLSGNGYNATYLGSTATTADTGAAGQLAYDCTSNGNTEIRGLAGPSKRVDISDSYSFSWWYKLTDPYESSTNHYAFDCRAGNSTSNRSGFSAVHRGSKLSVGIQRGTTWFSGNGNVATGLLSTDLTDWHHFCTTFDHTTGELKCWVDGVNTGTNTSTFTLPAVQPATPATTVGYLGNYISPAAIYTVSGNLDDSRHFTRVLTEAEIKHLASGRGVTGSPIQGLGDEVAWYCPTLAGNAGDLSGNGNAGTYNGGMGVIEEISSGGKRAFDFDGTDDYIEIANNASLYEYPITISYWVNQPGFPSNDGGEGYYSAADASLDGLRIYANPQADSGEIYEYAKDGANYAAFNINTGPAPVDQWAHFLLTVDENGTAWYRDGVLGGTTNWTGTTTQPSVASSIKIGANFNATDFLQGAMDDIRVFNRVLTQYEIAYLASDRGVQGAAPVEVDLDYLWSPTQGAETAVGPIANIGSAGTQDVNNVGTIAWVSDTDKNGTDAVDLAGNAYYRWNPMSEPYTPVTIGCWVKCDDADESGYICGVNSDTSDLWLAAEFRTSGNIRIWSGGLSQQVSDGGITKTDWNHIAITSNGTNSWLFLNGVEIATRVQIAATTFDELRFGTAGTSTFGVDGRMDGMFFQTRVLSDSEISLLAVDRTYPIPAPPPPTGAWHNPFRNSFFYNPFFDNEAL